MGRNVGDPSSPTTLTDTSHPGYLHHNFEFSVMFYLIFLTHKPTRLKNAVYTNVSKQTVRKVFSRVSVQRQQIVGF